MPARYIPSPLHNRIAIGYNKEQDTAPCACDKGLPVNMFDQMMLWAFLILPWITVFFMRRATLKRFMPVAILSALIVTIVFEIAHALHWWTMIEAIVPWGYITNVSFAYGIFVAGTLWIYAFTFGRLWLYLLTNAVIDGLQAFVFHQFFEGRIYRLDRIEEWQVFLLMYGTAIVLYIYQLWQDGVMVNGEDAGKEEWEFRPLRPFTWKEKAK